jgi:hypothetical protein
LLAASTLKSEELLNCSFQQAGYILLCSRSVPSNATERTNKPLPPSLMRREGGPPKECCCLLITSTEACMHYFFSDLAIINEGRRGVLSWHVFPVQHMVRACIWQSMVLAARLI